MSHTQLEHSQHSTKEKRYPVCLLVHDIDLGVNIGSLFRIADAFALEKIYLSGSSAVPPNRKINKTSRSTQKYVPFSYIENPLSIVDELKSSGYTAVSLEITSASINIRDLDISVNKKICLILGAENTGVCQNLINASDEVVHIPMLGENSSMNVAMACSIAAYEIVNKYQEIDPRK